MSEEEKENKVPDGEKGANNPVSKDPDTILGVSTTAEDLGSITVENLLHNETAIKMILYFYKIFQRENQSLKNELNTLKTYVDAYGQKKQNASTGAILMALSNVLIAFGVNMITGAAMTVPVNKLVLNSGIGLTISGCALLCAGLYFTAFKDNSQ